MYYQVIACEIMVREVCQAVAAAPSICDVTFLTQGFHDEVDPGRTAIQAALDELEPGRYDAVLLGYGLCNNLIAGLTATHTRLVVPRAHDCITVFLGDKDRYLEQFSATPGTYWYSSGWLECRTRRGGVDINQTGGHNSAMYEQFVAKYGEDNAKYLIEALGAWTEHYERGALIRFSFDQSLELDRRVREICDQHGWRYDEVSGSLRLLEMMVRGDWPERDFLVVQPGETIVPVHDGSVLAARSAG